jgi:hypothetical protein
VHRYLTPNHLLIPVAAVATAARVCSILVCLCLCDTELCKYHGGVLGFGLVWLVCVVHARI